MASQVKNGKAFEYALATELYAYLSTITSVNIIENDTYVKAKSCFDEFDQPTQHAFLTSANTSISFIVTAEPKLSHAVGEEDVLEISLASDSLGKRGDVRDILMVRSSQNWQIGISAKNNHRAVKHSRLSATLDFGEKWLETPCSDTYFDDIAPVFEALAERRRVSNKQATWTDIENMHDVIYVPILKAFQAELLRLNQINPAMVATNLVKYLIGRHDFYKVINGKKNVEIQAYNFDGTLNSPFQKTKSPYTINKLKLPSRLIEAVFAVDPKTKEDSKTTLLVSLNEGWQISFRIHNASSRIEPSLKFDINLISNPHNLFSHHIPILVSSPVA